MKKYFWLLIFISFWFVASTVLADINVQFVISVPPDTVGSNKIYITGNNSLLGDWKACGLKAKEIGPNLYLAEGKFDEGSLLEFKVTRGSFETVEKAQNGFEIPNRKYKVPSSGKGSVRIYVRNWADSGDSNVTPNLNITGIYKRIKQFSSKFLKLKRDIVVLLPPTYYLEKYKSKKYPVFYMHDGNNLFDPRLSFTGVDWGVDEACAKLYKQSKIKEIIVVGIYNTAERNSEYTPFIDPKHGGGSGEKYSQFLIKELMPHIDENFRTKIGPENTAIGGSSLGGLISIYIGLSHPNLFGSVMAMSPSIWWANGKMIEWVQKQDLPALKTKLWVDIGSNEGEEGVKYFKQFVESIKTKIKHLKYLEIPNAAHTENAWKNRMHLPLIWYFAK